MKKILILLLVVFLVSKFSVCQDSKPKSKDITYQLQFEYDENASNEMDSVFTIYCLISYLDVQDFEIIKIESGKNDKKMVSENYYISNLKIGNEIKIDLGIASENKNKIRVSIIDSKGNETKLTLKR